jgi:roadblock/LC7 domain-containing protein
MNKSIRNLALTVAILFSTAAPMFANMSGGNPHPQVAIALSLGDYASIVISVFGL